MFANVSRGRAGWWAAGVLLFVAVAYVVYSFVGTFVFGVFIYYATRPIYRRIRRRTSHGNIAAAIAIFALVLPALALVGYAILVIGQELQRFSFAFDLTQYPGINEQLLERFGDPASLLTGELLSYVTFDSLDGLVTSLSSAAGTFAFFGVGLLHLFVMVALAFYLLRDDRKIARWFTSTFGDEAGVLETYLTAVDRDFNSIFFGNILNAVLTGTIGVLAYSILNVFASTVAVPAPALVGLLAGVASLIPVVGMKLVYVPVALGMAVQALLAADTQALWFVFAFAVVSFVIVDTIPDVILRPYVSGRRLHVGAVMLSYTLGPLLFGWYGIFLMPMLLVTVVHFGRLVLPELLRGTVIHPYAVDPTYLAQGEDDEVTVDVASGELGRDFEFGSVKVREEE